HVVAAARTRGQPRILPLVADAAGLAERSIGDRASCYRFVHGWSVPRMDKVGIVYHPKYEAAQPFARDIAQRASSKVREVWVSSAWDDQSREGQVGGADLRVGCGGAGAARA